MFLPFFYQLVFGTSRQRLGLVFATHRIYQMGTTNFKPVAPPLGHIPQTMLAQVIRPSRYGNPLDAFALEEVAVPRIGPHECLVYVMAAGINYNNVWAALGRPIDVVAIHQRDGDTTPFHIGGSDASGVVWAVGDAVEGIGVGDEVVTHCGWWPKEITRARF